MKAGDRVGLRTRGGVRAVTLIRPSVWEGDEEWAHVRLDNGGNIAVEPWRVEPLDKGDIVGEDDPTMGHDSPEQETY